MFRPSNEKGAAGHVTHRDALCLTRPHGFPILLFIYLLTALNINEADNAEQ